MIYYHWEREVWCDTEDDDWEVDMTPESKSACEKEFATREEFYEWYKS
jgi:hypothetical protein